MASTQGALAAAALFMLACGSSQGSDDERARSGGAGVGALGGSSSSGGSRAAGSSGVGGAAAVTNTGGSGEISGSSAFAGSSTGGGVAGHATSAAGGSAVGGAGRASSSGGRGGSGDTSASGANPGGAAGNDENGGSGAPGAGAGLGEVQIVSLVDVASGGYAETTLTAYFSAPSSAPSNCQTTAFGPCTLYTCVAPTSADDPSPDAGSITANIDSVSFMETITPDQTGTYSSYFDENLHFHGGESISIVATGGAVPSFQDQIDFPEPLVLTAPVTTAPRGTAIRVPADQDLVLSWDGGVTGVTFQMSSPVTNPIALVCNQAAETGGVTIPASALGSLPTGTELALHTIAYHRLHLNGYDVDVVAGAGVKAPDMMRTLELVTE